ncbi:MAG: hypothetical protein ACFFCY_09715 [Promethearchaeota archaeon]
MNVSKNIEFEHYVVLKTVGSIIQMGEFIPFEMTLLSSRKSRVYL